MFREAKDYVEAQFTTVRDLEEKAGQIIRFNALIAGLVVAGLSVADISARAAPILGGLTTLGLTLLILSMGTAALAFHRSEMNLALRDEDVARALDFETTERGFLSSALEAYTRGIHENIDNVIARTNHVLSISIAGMTAAVAVFTLVATALIWNGIT